jgi:hypothetical protein
MGFRGFCHALLAIAAMAAIPLDACAQEATVSGSVADLTGGVLPGVTITATHEATGNTFLAVTDERGAFRMPVRTGAMILTAELPGFGTITRRLDLLVGQQVAVPIVMAPETLQERVVVSGDAPLIDTASSSLGSNIDRRQMQELPVNGRNWVDLTMLAPGARQNASTDELGTAIGTFQFNVDGLRVTQNQTAGFGQPHYSRDAISEFEFVSNRFDASQGGSSGVMVNAITKSGTNIYAGTFSGYFRDDKLVAKDFVQNRVLPYQDQQFSTTFGGPFRKDRIHFFANYEYEREPQTFSHSSPYPAFNFDLTGTRTEKKGVGRLDFQISPQLRLNVRGNKFVGWFPYDSRYTGGATRHPSSAIQTLRHSNDLSSSLTQVIGTSMVNEARAGYSGFFWIQDSILPWAGHPYPGLTHGTPIINLRGYTIGQAHTNSHEDERQDTYTAHDDLTFSFGMAGRHDVKTGAEFGYQQNPVFLCNRCMGIYDATGGAVPANVQQLFPVWNDVGSWNLNGLNAVVRTYTLGIGQMKAYAPLHMFSGWVQDDWKVASKLTLNLGLRYDLETGTFAENTSLEPFVKAGRKNDTNNWGPRAGFAYSLTDRTVLRGGAGKYFADPGSWLAYWTRLSAQALHPQVLNDGRADFTSNPFNGPVPTFDQVAATLCTVSPSATCLRRSINTVAAPTNEIPFSYQASAGMQHQLGENISVEADYVYTGTRASLVSVNRNLAYNTATGANYPFTDISKRPYPGWGTVGQNLSIGRSDYHALQASFTKRMTNRWQASATYLLSSQWNLQNAPIPVGCSSVTTLNPQGNPVCDVPVTLAADLQEERYLSPDQRNRATFNGIWDMGRGFQLSGLYLYGDGGWATPTSGVDVRATGGVAGRLRSDGTLIARNSFNLPSIHRVDMRLQRQFKLGPKARIDGLLEVFNAFNHRNLATFVTNESNARYGQPSGETNIAYQPRMAQLGFRVAF